MVVSYALDMNAAMWRPRSCTNQKLKFSKDHAFTQSVEEGGEAHEAPLL